MPLANIKVIEGVFDDTEKRQLIENVSEAIIAVEGEQIREKTIVILEETKSGDWGVGGQTLTSQQVRALREAS